MMLAGEEHRKTIQLFSSQWNPVSLLLWPNSMDQSSRFMSRSPTRLCVFRRSFRFARVWSIWKFSASCVCLVTSRAMLKP